MLFASYWADYGQSYRLFSARSSHPPLEIARLMETDVGRLATTALWHPNATQGLQRPL